MFRAKIREKSIGNVKPTRLLSIISVAALALLLGAATPQVWAGGTVPFEEGEIFFELNNTDGDLGIHGKLDGGPWKQVWIKDPYHRTMLNIVARGRLRQQAVTELFFESAEPPFEGDEEDEVTLTPEEFFERFPEGKYKIFGWSQDGKLLKSVATVTHLMPAPADGITLNGTPVDLEDVDCDDEETIPVVDGDTVTISWDPVIASHSDLGRTGEPVVIVNYEVVVEVELGEEGEEFTSVFSVILPPLEEPSMTIPEEFISLGLEYGEGEFKYEILAREESFNQTAVESCFVIEED